MKEETSHKNPEKHDEIECLENSGSSQNETPCPSAAAPTPADGQGVNNVSTEIYPIQNNDRSMAESVTRHVSNPHVEEFQFLLCGIDSLDLGLYVIWGSDWKRRLQSLDKKKQQARKQGGLLIHLPSGRICNFRPGGKGENYRFHLQFEAYNLFIGIAARPGSSPNVYLSIDAKTLWLNGIETALSWITEDLKTIGGGSIQFVQVSRLDLCADFWVHCGLSYEFLLSHKVTRDAEVGNFLVQALLGAMCFLTATVSVHQNGYYARNSAHQQVGGQNDMPTDEIFNRTQNQTKGKPIPRSISG
jgi:hypothetical protein